MKYVILIAILVILAGCSHEVAYQSEATFSNSRVDREKIRKVVQTHLEEFKACYTEALKTNPELAGKFVLQWTIGSSGKVTEVKVKTSTLSSSLVEECSMTKLKTWVFPSPPPGEVAVISYPFVFQSVE